MSRTIVGAGIALLVMALMSAVVPLHSSDAARAGATPVQPAISATYYNALPGFDIVVSGQHFTPLGRADVLILEKGGVREHDVVTANAQGAFTDKTLLACDFHAQAITAYDRRSGQWSNQAVLGAVCPG